MRSKPSLGAPSHGPRGNCRCDTERDFLGGSLNKVTCRTRDRKLTWSRGGSGHRLYEIGVISSDEGPVVVHAMPARDKYLR